MYHCMKDISRDLCSRSEVFGNICYIHTSKCKNKTLHRNDSQGNMIHFGIVIIILSI
jgi:hypothetical protein